MFKTFVSLLSGHASYAELIHSPTSMHSECSLPFTVVHLNTLDSKLPSGYIILSPACNVKVKFTLEQATKAKRWSRGIALLFLYPRRSMGWVVNVTPRPLYPRNSPGTICIGAGGESRTGLDGCGKSGPPLHRDSIPGPSSP
jgi:hypothetical protein